jgi:cytochrome oxidase Cu insertion factor (SCO1/SenC/PrrC family)|tara:strand:+ start:904 stop:1479 length:576 start_codon:yes stop_codon:yes gene_type:complete
MKKETRIIFYWFIAVIMCSSTGIFIILRDAKNGFGTVTFGKIPRFNLIDQNNNNVTREYLSTGPWVGSFISFDCEDNESCIKLFSINASIQQQLKKYNYVQIVTFHNNSNSTKLISLLNDLNIKLEKWKILFGDDEVIQSLSERILYNNLSESRIDDLLFLVDQNGIIRGYYQATKIYEVKKLINDAKKLI